MLNKFHSDTAYRAICCGFNVNEPTTGYTQKKGKEICPSAREAALESAKIK